MIRACCCDILTKPADSIYSMDSGALLTTSEVIVPAVAALCSGGHDGSDETPNIQFSSLSINLEMAALQNPVDYSDRTCFRTQFATEIDLMIKIEQLLTQGEVLVHMLYTFRSVSKAVPLVYLRDLIKHFVFVDT